MAANIFTSFPLFFIPNGALAYFRSFVLPLGFSSGVRALDVGVWSAYNFDHRVLHHLEVPKVSAKVRRMGKEAVAKPLWGAPIATPILVWRTRRGARVEGAGAVFLLLLKFIYTHHTRAAAELPK